jgi:xanthine dehydrogenase molybdopterin-binding subunit B
MAEVEVDLGLGTVEVLRIDAAHDAGKVINPTQVEGQIHGGIAQGLGMALMEEHVSGRTDHLQIISSRHAAIFRRSPRPWWEIQSRSGPTAPRVWSNPL